MDTGLMFRYAALVLFVVGLAGLLLVPHLLRRIMALNIMGAAVFLFLVATAYRGPDQAPDPVPHAMVLTGIVIAVSATGLALALVRRLYVDTGEAQLPEDRG
jgi:multicomponent Na+:H+ antiporter subunit C